MQTQCHEKFTLYFNVLRWRRLDVRPIPTATKPPYRFQTSPPGTARTAPASASAMSSISVGSVPPDASGTTNGAFGPLSVVVRFGGALPDVNGHGSLAKVPNRYAQVFEARSFSARSRRLWGRHQTA
jgi:hypothetical protein